MFHLTLGRAATAAGLVCSAVCFGTATAAADPSDTLAGSLSKGYSPSNCTSQAPPNGVAAVLQCGHNNDPNGPVFAKYMLFNNPGDLAGSFANSIKADTLTNCGDTQSPTVWHQGSNTDSAGKVACGTYQGQAEVIWTTDAKNVMSLIRGSGGDVAALYQWWQSNG
ncbi:serine/threonine protein kinase [Mycobacterium sp. 663a-19]|uniref:serine/threonine protein kinase n=1 Tax=Mycobacterium sp. 663a-19 TaxID=2986148 RepID=UPI002D1F0875|nr:serine/threonine protein kinase [Mycobacterium sp. 663a-19]MEB3984081.1 serine/threonine protein kinase [Mycobacterium sp. 663a-19]